MDQHIISFLKTRWGLEWIRLRQRPVILTTVSTFVRDIKIDKEVLLKHGISNVKWEGIRNLSGLIAGTLASLQWKDKGLFQVSYVSSTNSVGVALLEDYLVTNISKLGVEPVNLSNITRTGTLLEVISDDKKTVYTESSSYWTDLLTKLQRDRSFPSDKSYTYEIPPNTDALVIADSTPDTLLSILNKAPINDRACILLYLNEIYNWPKIWREIENLVTHKSKSASVLICTTEKTAKSIASTWYARYPENLISLAGFFNNRIGATILIHNDNEFAIANQDKNAQVNFPEPIKTIELARCLSGILLSSAVTHCIQQLGGPEDLYADLPEQLLYGYTWANLQPNVGDFPTEAEFLKCLDHFAQLEDLRLPSIIKPNQIPFTLLNMINHVADRNETVRELAHFLQFENDIVTSAVVDRLQQINRLSDLPRPAEERIIFLDLDLTLFDYTSARRAGAIVALKELPMAVPVDVALGIYNQILNHWAALELIGFPNLRRVWNDESIYYITYLLTSGDLKDKAKEIFELLKRVENAEDNTTVIQDYIQKTEIGQDFMEAIKLIYADIQLQQNVRRAYIAFEKATEQLQPFEDARDILSTLSNIDGYHVFIVTEGDLSIQWEKIEKLGLADLVSPKNLIVTDGLANQPVLMSALTQVEKIIEKHLSRRGSNRERLELENEVIQFYKEMLARFHYKRDGHFYRHALHVAIGEITGQKRENEFANVSSEDWNMLRPIKLASIGDRYTNDILPLLHLFSCDKVLTIRMLYGKYQNEKPAPSSPQPDFTVTRLAAARNFLLQERHWSKKSPIERPSHFGLKLEKNDLIYVLVGLSMPLPIASISKALLEDKGASTNTIDKLYQQVTNELNIRENSQPLRTRLSRILEKEIWNSKEV